MARTAFKWIALLSVPAAFWGYLIYCFVGWSEFDLLSEYKKRHKSAYGIDIEIVEPYYSKEYYFGLVPEGALVYSPSDDVYFRVGAEGRFGREHSTYVSEKLGKDFYSRYVKKYLDETYGEGNYFAWVHVYDDQFDTGEFVSAEGLASYDFDSREDMSVVINIVIRDANPNAYLEAERLYPLTTLGVTSLQLDVGYFEEFPSKDELIKYFALYSRVGKMYANYFAPSLTGSLLYYSDFHDDEDTTEILADLVNSLITDKSKHMKWYIGTME